MEDEAPRADDSGADLHGSTLHGSVHGHGASEHRPPERIPHSPEAPEEAPRSTRRRSKPDVTDEDPGTDLDAPVEEEATPEEVAEHARKFEKETERWAPKKISDVAVDIEKVCRVCGKNLKGHRRYKDERGYICPQCDRDERARRIPCAECGKPVPPESLRPWGPISICVRCWADHQNDPKLRMRRKVSSRPWEELEKRTVLAITAIVVVALLVLWIIQLLS